MISMRSTKAEMFAEIERLRERCEALEQQLRVASQPERSLEPSERRIQLEALKAFATKFRCSARLRDGVIELYSKQRGCWVAVPEGEQP